MEVDWSVVVNEAVTALLKVFVPVLVALVLKWAGELWLKVKEENPTLYSLLYTAAEIGLYAAEEYFRGKSGVSGQKMEYAIERAKAYLQEFGQDVDESVLRDKIIASGVENQVFSWTKEVDDAKPE